MARTSSPSPSGHCTARQTAAMPKPPAQSAASRVGVLPLPSHPASRVRRPSPAPAETSAASAGAPSHRQSLGCSPGSGGGWGLRRWRHWSQRGRARACALCWRGGWAAGARPPGWRRSARAALAWRQSALPCSGRWGWAKRCGPSCGQKNPAGSGRKARRIGIVLDTGGRIEYNTMDIMAEQAHGALDPAAGNAGKNGCGQIPPRCKRGFL